MNAGIRKYPLGRQPPRARAHRYTTTSACAHRGKVLAHHILHSGLKALNGQQTSVSAWINILNPEIQIFFSIPGCCPEEVIGVELNRLFLRRGWR
jgi:hypothetical protein